MCRSRLVASVPECSGSWTFERFWTFWFLGALMLWFLNVLAFWCLDVLVLASDGAVLLALLADSAYVGLLFFVHDWLSSIMSSASSL